MAVQNWERCKNEQKHSKTENSVKMTKNQKLDFKTSEINDTTIKNIQAMDLDEFNKEALKFLNQKRSKS